MNLSDLTGAETIGFIFVVLFIGLMLLFLAIGRDRPRRFLRDIPAFTRLGRSIGLAVEAGERLHISLGRGEITGLQGASGLIGLVLLQRITRTAAAGDRPTIATSGDGALTILSQDSLRGVYRPNGAGMSFDPRHAQLTGTTPFSYAAGTLPVIFDRQVNTNVLAGHFGPEVALITDAGERSGGMTLAGSDSLPAQAIIFATAQEPLVGEELYAAGAYVQAGPAHFASLRAEDVLRWVLALVILGGTFLHLAGVL